MQLPLTLIRSQIVNAVSKNEIKLTNKRYLQCCRWLSTISLTEHMKRNISFRSGGLLKKTRHDVQVPKICDRKGILQRLNDPYYGVIILVHHLSSTPVTRSKTLSVSELKKAIEQLTDYFMEARELLDDARESIGTIYFTDDMNEARRAVVTTLERYQTLLAQLSEDQKQEVLRTIGLKMEELKAQEQSIKDSLHG